MTWKKTLITLVIALAFPLAGCIGAADDDFEPEPIVADNTSAEPNATLPDGRGESAGLKETNITEQGVGGMDHKHDYWKGKEQVVLFDGAVGLFCPPCMPDGEGTSPKSVAYLKLGKLPDGSDDDALVYEGADRVEMLFSTPSLFEGVAHPAPAALFVQYRSAADADWREPMPVTYGTPVSIDVTPQMTDMPHSTRSLWVFRISTDKPDYLEAPLTITVFKGRDVVDWPGHPDFYAETDARVVMNQHVTTHMSGLESFALYDSGGTWASPEKLISWGTKEIVVIANVTGASNAYGAEPTGFFLEAHDATIIGPEITFGSRHSEIDDNNDLKTYVFHLLVSEAGMDGPYQPSSRWGFRLMATFADFDTPVGGLGLCPGCFPYDIEYDIKVFALGYETGRGEEMEEL
jgi:hypothetical protein